MTLAPSNSSDISLTRANRRRVIQGNIFWCHHCGGDIDFNAHRKTFQIICNVYEDGVWDRQEIFHEDCYKKAGRPYGNLKPSKAPRADGFSLQN